jgi:hypothetical protein
MPIFEAFVLAAPEIVASDVAAEEAARLAAEEAARQAAIQAAQEEAARAAAQQAAQQTTQQGITQVAQNSTMTPAQEAYMRASSASAGPGITQGTVPLAPAGAPAAAPNLNYAANSTSLTNAVSPAFNYSPYAPDPVTTQGINTSAGAQGLRGVTAMGTPMNAATAMTAEPSALAKGWDTATTWMGAHPYYTAAGAYLGASKLGLFDPKKQTFNDDKYNGPLSRYQMSSDFQARHADPTQYQYTPHYAEGGIMGYAAGGPVEQMSNNAVIGANTMYPMANMTTSAFATPYQTPQSTNMMQNMAPSGGGTVDQMSGEPNMQGTRLAAGGQVPRYGFGGFLGDAVQNVGNGIGSALGGVSNTVADIGSNMGHMFKGGDDAGWQKVMEMTGKPQTADQIAKKYSTDTLAQNNVSPQQYQYSPQYAEGGVTRYAKGNLTSSLNYYTDMLGGERERQIAEASNPIGGKGDAGVIRDSDPDTAYLSAPEAAAVRMGKINAKANMQGLTLPRPKPIGRLNLKPQGVQQAAASGSSLDPEMAAQGGIMHSSLGGYAAGGNPRLLKGPGDGMSDNIPATIAGRQPARLADGEFVVPADVVSHLGNGSTDAGAKKLHEMMDKIRKARTGNPKQGKQINPNKFIPR